MVFYKIWCEHEVFYINDLYDYMGDCFSQYNLNANYLHHYRFLDSIPISWKNILKNSKENKQTNIKLKKTHNHNVMKIFYKLALENRHGAMDHRIDPSWWTHWGISYFQPVLHDWCNKGCGMWYPVCGMRTGIVRWIIGSILHGRPIELFLIPASAPRLV